MPEDKPARTCFCDRLTPRSALALRRLKARRASILDPIDGGWSTRLARLALRVAGCEVSEAQFFTGDLREAEGETVFLSARQIASELALRVARALVASVPALDDLNRRVGREVVALFLARRLWGSLERQAAQIRIADLIGPSDGDVTLVLAQSPAFDPSVFTGVAPRVRLASYLDRPRWLEWLLLVARTIAEAAMPAVDRWAPFFRHSVPGHGTATSPGLLLTQEDDLSLDRSYRTQPHWLDGPSTFPVWVLKDAGAGRLPVDVEALAASGIHVLDRGQVAWLDRRAGRDALRLNLSADIRRCLLAAARSRQDGSAHACGLVLRLLVRTRVLAGVCQALAIRAFVCGEPLLWDGDALEIIAEQLGITTVAYQYSNLATSSPVMLTAAEILVAFGPRSHALWTFDGIGPRRFLDAGYPYDSAFVTVRPRARAWRQQLETAGARFVFCYFDENVGRHRYGFSSVAEHADELRQLATLVVDDPTVGLVVKSQFQKNSLGALDTGDPVMARALATGRVLDLRHGVHRNIVFPAEAAQVADVAIGHVVGATAALEAALVGTRCVMLNAKNVRTVNDELYARAALVFASMREALAAVGRYRAGDPAFRSVGDWTPVLDEFDPYRDGGAAGRLRQLLTSLVTSGAASGEGRSSRPRQAGLP